MGFVPYVAVIVIWALATLFNHGSVAMVTLFLVNYPRYGKIIFLPSDNCTKRLNAQSNSVYFEAMLSCRVLYYTVIYSSCKVGKGTGAGYCCGTYVILLVVSQYVSRVRSSLIQYHWLAY